MSKFILEPKRSHNKKAYKQNVEYSRNVIKSIAPNLFNILNMNQKDYNIKKIGNKKWQHT